MKAILVIDMPTECVECPLVYVGGMGEWACKPTERPIQDKVCPLRPLPPKREIPIRTPFCKGEAKGWNECLEVILGETE